MALKYIFLISRLASFVIDNILFYILLYFFSKFSTAGYVACLVIFFVYRFLTTAYFGATLGMMALKLKLKNYNFKICLKREIYRLASAFFYIGYIYAVIDYKNRTFHDIASGTYVYYGKGKEEEVKTSPLIVTIANIFLIVFVIRWSTSFIINDIGLIGLKKVCTSDEYFQSFDGDNLVSLSQDELYKKTLGRKYSTLIDIDGKPFLIRISNKRTYTEVYKLNIVDKKMIGEYLYKLNIPLQYICSGQFVNGKDLCGVSPNNQIILVNQNGGIYGSNNIGILNVVTLRCGDVDNDGFDEAVVLGREGEVEVFKYSLGELKKIFSGKVGEDVLPETFYIDKGIVIVSKLNDQKILYFYGFKNNKFTFVDKKYFKVNGASTILKVGDDILVSNVSRNNMTFKTGRIQRLEMYSINNKIKKLYDFGGRPGRRYAYMVRILEGVYDIDRDGKEEIILKAVGKEDVMGQGYAIEVYKLNRGVLWINRILTKVEGILLINNR
jgi:uncharacterized RDD family membrane protein YckC/predicted nucleic-acid-binding Zn-ribbon protein